jgi:hypothetical protein
VDETARTGGRDQGEVTMATKTVVCPDCGSPTAPGRYTCSECGAFLDGVAVAPRSWDADATAGEAAAAGPEPLDEPPAPVAPRASVLLDGIDDPEPEDGPPAEAPAPMPDPGIRAPAASLPEADDLLLADGPTLDPVDPTLPPPPDVLHEIEWPASETAERPTGGPTAAGAAGVRTPAGAWLPPSALLTGLDDASPAGAAAATATMAASAPARAPRDWLALFGSADERWAFARRMIAIGAVVAVVGFLLPWANGSASSILAVWTSVWGLAGAGHWLIVLVAAALGLVASSSSPRVTSVALGLPSIALASLLLGLVWPTVLGAASRPIGVLAVLVGAVVLGIGGVIHLGARHEAATPDV